MNTSGGSARRNHIVVSFQDDGETVAALLHKFEAVLLAQSTLCDRLEALADDLPDHADGLLCVELSESLQANIKQMHDFEELELYPLIAPVVGAGPAATIERLKVEHWGDQDYAADLGSALRDFAVRRANAETLGWMLRGFFESVRRHIAFDREHLIPLVEQHWERTFGNA